MAVPSACASRWDDIRASFERHRDELATSYPDALEEIGLIHTALIKIGQLIRSSPPINGNSPTWKKLTAQAESERAVLCKHLDGKPMLTGMRRLYAATFRQMAESTVPEATEQATEKADEFREQRRRKRVPSGDNSQALQAKKSSNKAPPQVQTRNFYAPLKSAMEVEERQGNSSTDAGDKAPSQAGRPPPIFLTATTNRLQLQKKLRAFVKGSFDFRNTRNRTRIVTKELSDFSVITAFFQEENLSFYTVHPKSLKPIKAVIRHLPSLTPAEEIYEALEGLGFDIISVRQMT
jgi:hypothetical protein